MNAFKHIAQGQILEYLPDEEREFFEPLLAEKPTEQEVQNPEDQGAAHTEIETVAQKGIHRQVLNIECRDSFLGFYVEDYEIDDPTIAEQLTTFFREWRSSPSRPTILFIDELAKLKAMQPTWYKKFFIPQCVVEGSSGETEHRFLWLATISPLIGDLGISGGDRSVFDIVTLQTVATRDHRESVKKSVASLEALPTDEQFKISPVGTLVFHSAIGLWAAVPSYPVPQILPGDRLCPEIARLFQTVSTRETISESSLSAETISDSVSNCETSISPGSQASLDSPETISFQGISDHEPMPSRARVCLELKQKGWTQTDIIELIWGVKAGGSEGYKKAIAEYRAIASEYNL